MKSDDGGSCPKVRKLPVQPVKTTLRKHHNSSSVIAKIARVRFTNDLLFKSGRLYTLRDPVAAMADSWPESLAAAATVRADTPVFHWALVPIAVLVAAETTILLGFPTAGITVHSLVLLALLWTIGHDPDHHPVYEGIVFVPLLRLLNLGSGLLDISPLLWLLVVYVMLFVSVILALRANETGANDLGILPQGNVYHWGLLVGTGVPVGAALGWIQWTFDLEQPPVTPTAVNLLELVLVTGLVVGVVEELLFRGLIQRWLSDLVGRWSAIIAASVLFGFMHSVWFKPTDVLFAFLVSLFLGWSYARTRNLWFISVVHGSINVAAFAFLPILLS